MSPVEHSSSPLEGAALQADTRHRLLFVQTAPVPGRLRATVGAASVEGPADGKLRLDLPEAGLWSPKTPELLDLRLEWSEKEAVLETRELRTGLRHAEMRDGRFHLNGRVLPLFGARAGAGTLPDADDAAAFVGRLEKMGVTLVRVEAAAEAVPLLDACDEAGMLVWLDLPRSLDDPSFVRQVFAAYGHHPAVVIWGGARGACAEIQPLSPNTIEMVIAGKPGWLAGAMPDWQPMTRLSVRFDIPPDPQEMHALRHMGAPGVPAWATGSAPEADALPPIMAATNNDAVRSAWRLHGRAVAERLADAFWANTALTGWDLPLEAWPAPSSPPGKGQSGDDPACHLALHMERTNLLAEEETRVQAVLVNPRRALTQADLSLQVTGPTQQTLWKKKRSVRCAPGTKELWSGSVAGSSAPGPHRFVVRLMDGMHRLAQRDQEFHVFEPAPSFRRPARLVDPQDRWRSLLAAFLPGEREHARVLIIPPLHNTIRAYPADEMTEALAEVREGAAALVLQPPPDWNDLADRVEDLPRATPAALPGAVPVVRLHALFEGLPSRMLMGGAYAGVAPRHFVEETGEEPAGLVQDASGRKGAFLSMQRFGSGRLLFSTLRLPGDALGEDPLAGRLLVNLLRHLESWSAPPSERPSPVAAAYDWLKTSRTSRVRRWAVAGPLPWDSQTQPPFPPEAGADLEAVYPGWAGAVGWRRWLATDAEDFWVDLQAACSPFAAAVTQDDPGTACAYAECHASARMAGRVVFESTQPGQCWLNGKPVALLEEDDIEGKAASQATEAVLREGRNTILCCARKLWGPWRVRVEFEGPRGGSLPVSWWR